MTGQWVQLVCFLAVYFPAVLAGTKHIVYYDAGGFFDIVFGILKDSNVLSV